MRLSYQSLSTMVLIWPIVGFPILVSITSFFDIPNTTFSIIARAVVFFIALIAIARTNFRTLIHQRRWQILLIIFWLLYFSRILYDINFRPYLVRSPQMIVLFSFAGCFIPMVGLMMSRGKINTSIFYKTVLLLGSSAALIMWSLGTTSVESESGEIYDIGRHHLRALNPISVGHFGATIFLVSYWFLREKIKPFTLNKFIPLFSLFIGLITLVMSGSKGPFVSLLASVLFYEFALKGNMKFLVLTFYLVLTATVILFLDLSQFVIAQRFEDGEAESVLGRIQLYLLAIDQFIQNPLLGSALVEVTTGFYPHNIFVEAFMALGIIGGLMLLCLLAKITSLAYKLVNRESSYGGIAILYIQYLVGAQFSGALWGLVALWALVGCIINFNVTSTEFGSRKYSNLIVKAGI